MSEVVESIRAGKYKNTLPSPWDLERPTLDHENMTGKQVREAKEAFEAKRLDVRRAYNAEDRRLNQLFVADLEQENGLTGHPKASRVYEMAYERAHSEGNEAVAWTYAELAELVKS